MIKTITTKIVSAVCSAALLFGSLALTVNAAAVASSANEPIVANESKPDFNYVAFGASNTNGYGLHGYNFDYVYEAPFEKAVENRYGYKMDAPGSYPVLVSERLSEKYNVNLSLIAMSSMRSEELRFLLDENYMGDSYTDAWLYDTNGDGVSSNWCYYAGVYEWQKRAEAGLPGYDHEPDKAEALAALRDACRVAVEESDLITIDVGMNSFGTYMLNLLAGGKIFTSDLATIDPEFAELYNKVKTYVLAAVDRIMEGKLSPALLSGFADTLSYAVVGYCASMDAIMEKIYSIKPDADVIVVGIQSIMSGLDLVLPGLDMKLPLGEIFDYVVNSANLYMTSLSPYADKYLYANASENSHTTFFMDEISDYNGDPASLSLNMKDCLDVYDDNLFLKTRIQQKFAILMGEKGIVNIDDSLKDTETIEGIAAFHYGFHYDFDSKYNSPVVTMSDGTPMKDFLKKGEEGRLSGEWAKVYEIYEKMLMTAYDVAAEIMSVGAKAPTMDLSVILSLSALNLSANTIILKAINKALDDLSGNENYVFDLDDEYPEGFFEALAKEYNVPLGAIDTLFAYSMRLSFGGTIFSHPNVEGHKEVCDYIMDAYNGRVTGGEVIADQIGVDYLPDEDSYYVAVDDSAANYADLFAEALGLGNGNFEKTSWNSIDYDKINKADLISLAINEGEILSFAAKQAVGFIGDYIADGGRLAMIDYVTSLVRESAILSTLNFEIIMINRLNFTVLNFLDNGIFANRATEELDWSRLLDEEHLPMVELARSEFRRAVIGIIGGSDEFTVEIDVVNWLRENADAFGLAPMATAILKSSDFLYDILGDKAFLQLKIPVVDGVVFALESYLYKYVENTLNSCALISHVNSNNPDAKIVILGSHNPIRCAASAVGELPISMGDLFELAVFSSTVRDIVQFGTSDNSTFVYIPAARSEYELAAERGEIGTDLMSFIKLCLNEKQMLAISSEDNQYVADRMLRCVNILCDHVYDSDCDHICNKCSEEREAVPHVRNLCTDTVCVSCGYGIEPKDHIFGEWTVTKEAGILLEGEEQRSCAECEKTETRSIPAKGVENADEGEITLLVVCAAVAAAILAGGGFCLYWFVIRKKISSAKTNSSPDDKKSSSDEE